MLKPLSNADEPDFFAAAFIYGHRVLWSGDDGPTNSLDEPDWIEQSGALSSLISVQKSGLGSLQSGDDGPMKNLHVAIISPCVHI